MLGMKKTRFFCALLDVVMRKKTRGVFLSWLTYSSHAFPTLSSSIAGATDGGYSSSAVNGVLTLREIV